MQSSRLSIAIVLSLAGTAFAETPHKFFDAHCVTCHDAQTKSAGLDLTALKFNPTDADNFARWVKIHDRITANEMPPKKKPRPPAADVAAVTGWLHDELAGAERKAAAGNGRTRLRRMTRAEYENTLRDLFDLPGLPLQGD